MDQKPDRRGTQIGLADNQGMAEEVLNVEAIAIIVKGVIGIDVDCVNFL